jgi:hypothetical protein
MGLGFDVEMSCGVHLRNRKGSPTKRGGFCCGTWEITRATLSLPTPSSIVCTVASNETSKLQHVLRTNAGLLIAEYVRRTTEMDRYVAQITVAQPTGQSE